MKLTYTPKSHFARKVRILLDAWGAAVDLVDVGNVAESANIFAGNPLMMVPALTDGEVTVFEPEMTAARRDELYAGWKQAVERVLL